MIISKQGNVNSFINGDYGQTEADQGLEEFAMVKREEVNEPLDAVGDTHCTYLREPLLSDEY